MKISKHPDGTSYVTAEHSGEEVTTFKVNTYEDLHHLEQFVDAYNNKYHQEPLIIIPNLIDAQADRRFADNQSSGLKIICKRLNSMKASFKIFHPHNPEVVEALLNKVELINNTEFIYNVLKELKLQDTIVNHIRADISNTVLMSSDAGGFKPLMALCDRINWKGETYSASKARTKGGMQQLVGKEDFKGKDVLIVDDISVYGGTFKGLSTLLRTKNCGKIYLVVSHMTMQNLGKDPVTNYFDKVFTTNSKFDNYYTELDKYLTSDDEGNEYMNTGRIYPSNLNIIKLF